MPRTQSTSSTSQLGQAATWWNASVVVLAVWCWVIWPNSDNSESPLEQGTAEQASSIAPQTLPYSSEIAPLQLIPFDTVRTDYVQQHSNSQDTLYRLPPTEHPYQQAPRSPVLKTETKRKTRQQKQVRVASAAPQLERYELPGNIEMYAARLSAVDQYEEILPEITAPIAPVLSNSITPIAATPTETPRMAAVHAWPSNQETPTRDWEEAAPKTSVAAPQVVPRIVQEIHSQQASSARPAESNLIEGSLASATPSRSASGKTEFDNDAKLATNATADEILSYTPHLTEISQKLLPEVQKAFAIAQRGALYAARARFINVLRTIAITKDAATHSNVHSEALAVGLRALDEADDFMPRGTQLEGNLDLPAIASSHRSPLLGNRSGDILPHEAIAIYHTYAHRKLGLAVAGEQAGSMALLGLGKAHNRLASRENKSLSHQRKAITMFQAALVAHDENHFAANELGVSFASGGHYRNALQAFERSALLKPSSTVYRNLAHVLHKLDRPEDAIACTSWSQRMASQEMAQGQMSRQRGIRWMSPQQFAKSSEGVPKTTPPGLQRPSVQQPIAPNMAQSKALAPPSLWNKATRTARQIVPGRLRVAGKKVGTSQQQTNVPAGRWR